MTDAEMRARILEKAAVPAPTRAELRVRDTAMVIAGVSLGTALFLWKGGFRDWGAPRPAELIALTLAGIVGIAVAAATVAYGQGASMLGRPTRTLVAVALASPAALFVWKVLWSSMFDGGTDFDPGRVGYRCLALSSAIGASILTGFFMARRGTDPVHPGASGAAMGVAAGAIAEVYTELWCPVGHPGHVLLGHVLPMMLLGIVGALIGRTVLGMRRAGR